MYTPKSFAETDLGKLHAFMENHSFATVVSQAGDAPVATHLPLLLDREAGSQGELIGHMARPNPQWQSAAGQQVLAIFHGPHAYISPTHYEAENVVPTWNYVVVHVTGKLQLDDSLAAREKIVRQYVETYEAPMESPWSLDQLDADFTAKLLEAIVGFRISIDKIEGKWKLSQNHPPERREKINRVLLDLWNEIP